MQRAYIGIGSNIDRENNIRSGVAQLKRFGMDVLVSSVYESRAYGFKGDNFYNLAIGMDTDIAAEDFIRTLRDIEERHGRTRHVPRFSSRTLDLDLLLYGDMVCHDENIDVPRKDIMTCSFVLRPLAEIAGDFRHPESGIRIREIWETFDRPGQEIWAVEFNPEENR